VTIINLITSSYILELSLLKVKNLLAKKLKLIAIKYPNELDTYLLTLRYSLSKNVIRKLITTPIIPIRENFSNTLIKIIKHV
tara:strand:+ start:1561 stop:1806 length:246 start_codon:yes stop_codon:yes gene_type:complete